MHALFSRLLMVLLAPMFCYGFPCYEAFVSTPTYTGKIGGRSGGDNICNSLANASDAVKGDKFVAWLSTGSQLAQYLVLDGCYMLLDGTLIAPNKPSLLDGNLNHPIRITDKGMPLSGSTSVWTGTDAMGGLRSNCGGWTIGATPSPISYGRQGDAGLSTRSWSDLNNAPCSTFAHIYCFGKTLVPLPTPTRVPTTAPTNTPTLIPSAATTLTLITATSSAASTETLPPFTTVSAAATFSMGSTTPSPSTSTSTAGAPGASSAMSTAAPTYYSTTMHMNLTSVEPPFENNTKSVVTSTGALTIGEPSAPWVGLIIGVCAAVLFCSILSILLTVWYRRRRTRAVRLSKEMDTSNVRYGRASDVQLQKPPLRHSRSRSRSHTRLSRTMRSRKETMNTLDATSSLYNEQPRHSLAPQYEVVPYLPVASGKTSSVGVQSSPSSHYEELSLGPAMYAETSLVHAQRSPSSQVYKGKSGLPSRTALPHNLQIAGTDYGDDDLSYYG